MSASLRSSTVGDLIRRSAARVPDRVAIRFADRELTYRRLDEAVNRAATYLIGHGAKQGDRVAAYGKNSDAYVIAFLACARAGLVHVPLNYALTGDELDYLVTDSGSSIVLADPALAPALPRRAHRVLMLRDAEDSLLAAALSEAAFDRAEVDSRQATLNETDLVQLLYTSGTTSKPKGAMMSHRALVHEYLSCMVGLDLSAEDNPLHVMPLYHSAQMHVFLIPQLALGATNTILESPDPGDILRRLSRDGHHSFFAAPTLWVALANHPDLAASDLSQVRRCYYGASIMPGPVLKRLQEKMPEGGFYNCFGQSEIAPLAAILRPEEHAERPDSAGRPALFVQLRVVDPDGNDVAVGESGEVVYRSPQLCDGYWGKEAETEEAFSGGWFHSGDMVRMDEQGYLFVVDRIKDVINTGGVLVASREVEDALYTHPAVAESAVIGVPDEKWVEAVRAVVVLKGEATEQELIEYLRGKLAPFKIPKSVQIVDELPRNASGKILKRKLRPQ